MKSMLEQKLIAGSCDNAAMKRNAVENHRVDILGLRSRAHAVDMLLDDTDVTR
jgi:hypothetical protein